MKQLRQPRTWLGIAMSAVALYFAVRGVSLAELARELARANYAWLVPSIAVIVAGQLARAERWRVFFGQSPRPPFRDAFAILSIGYFVSNVLPLRLGDPLRAWLVESKSEGGGAEALATVLVERVVDFLTIAVLLSVWVPVPASRLLVQEFGAGAWSKPGILRLTALALVAAVWIALTVVSASSEGLARATRGLLERLGISPEASGRVATQVARFAAGFAPLRRGRTAIAAVAWCIVVWLLGGLASWLVMQSFHLDLPFEAAMFVLCATALFAVLPASPGYVGTFHYAIRQGVILYGAMIGSYVPAPTAVSFAIVLHGVTFLVLVALGLAGMWLVGMTGGDLGRSLERAEAES